MSDVIHICKGEYMSDVCVCAGAINLELEVCGGVTYDTYKRTFRSTPVTPN